MTTRVPALGASLLLCITVGLLGWSAAASGSAASASAVKKPKPSPSPAPAATFIKAYAALVNGTRFDLSPLDVQATSDGGLSRWRRPNRPPAWVWTGWSN